MIPEYPLGPCTCGAMSCKDKGAREYLICLLIEADVMRFNPETFDLECLRCGHSGVFHDDATPESAF